MKPRQVVVFIGIGIWTAAAISTFLTFLYVFTMGLGGDDVMSIQKAHVRMLAGGLLPWILAHALTRILYGVEILVEP